MDRLQAEARFYLYVVTVLVLLVLFNFVGWAFVQDAIRTDPVGTTATVFFGCQIASALLFALTCVVGFRPSVEITVSGRWIEIVQGSREDRIRISTIIGLETVPALTFHRVHRRYDGIIEFSGRSGADYVLIRLVDRTVALGLEEEQRDTLYEWLEGDLAQDKRAPAAASWKEASQT